MPFTSRAFWLLAVSVTCLLPTPVSGVGTIGLYADTGGIVPEVIAPANTVAEFHLVMVSTDSVSSVRFSLYPTPAFASTTFYLGLDTFGYEQSGNPEFDVTVSFGECLSGTIHIGTVKYYVTDELECGEMSILGPFLQSGPQAVSCGGGSTGISGLLGHLSTKSAHYSLRLPPNGATGVPTNTQLNWHEWFCWEGPGDCLSASCDEVHFGTDPGNLVEYLVGGHANWFDPGPLAPNTRYYWRLNTWYVNDDSMWSFTTGASSVAVEARTWSSIKALYK